MIRSTRGYLLGKSFYNIPKFTQRAVISPKQIFVEFCIAADKELQPPSKESNKNSTASEEKLKNSSFVASYSEMKHAFLKDIFSNNVIDNTTMRQRDLVLKDFFANFPSLTPPEIIKVLKLWSETNNRPVVSIKALCSILLKRDWKYTFDECSDLLYTLARLSYRDVGVIELIANQLKLNESICTAKDSGHVLYTLSDLRYRDCELIDKLLQNVLREEHTIRTLLHCLRAASFLNYSSSDVDSVIKVLSELKETDFVQTIDYINFIWSCIILKKQHFLTATHFKTVLSEAYISKLLQNGVHISVKWKLLNINAAAIQLESYDGPYLHTLPSYRIMSLSIPNQRTSFLDSVLDALSHIVPEKGSVKSLVNTGAGFYLDVEYCEEVNESPESEKLEPKIGILLINFNDVCSDGTLTGLSEFKLNILKGMGYKTVPILYSEYNPNLSLAEKMEFLRRKVGTMESYFMDTKVKDKTNC